MRTRRNVALHKHNRSRYLVCANLFFDKFDYFHALEAGSGT